jgi:hypothetical protein
MSSEYSIYGEGLQASPVVAKLLSQQLTACVQPLLIWLDALVDLRLVQTFLATLLSEFKAEGGLPTRTHKGIFPYEKAAPCVGKGFVIAIVSHHSLTQETLYLEDNGQFFTGSLPLHYPNYSFPC